MTEPTSTRRYGDRIEAMWCTDECLRLGKAAAELSDVTCECDDDGCSGIDPVKDLAHKKAWLPAYQAHLKCVTVIEYREAAS